MEIFLQQKLSTNKYKRLKFGNLPTARSVGNLFVTSGSRIDCVHSRLADLIFCSQDQRLAKIHRFIEPMMFNLLNSRLIQEIEAQ